MSRIGTKKPPIKNAYYAPQEHVPSMHRYGKSINTKAAFMNASNSVKDEYKSNNLEKE